MAEPDHGLSLEAAIREKYCCSSDEEDSLLPAKKAIMST